MRRYIWAGMAALALLAGCSRNDQQVATDVQNKINADTYFPDKGLSVSASKGVVTLTGNVSSDAARNAAANDAAQVPGVKTVINNLQVTPAATAETMPHRAYAVSCRRGADSGSGPDAGQQSLGHAVEHPPDGSVGL